MLESVSTRMRVTYVRWRRVIMIVCYIILITDDIALMRVLWSMWHSSVYNRGV